MALVICDKQKGDRTVNCVQGAFPRLDVATLPWRVWNGTRPARVTPEEMLRTVDGLRHQIECRKPSVYIFVGGQSTRLLVSFLVPDNERADDTDVFEDGSLKNASALRWAGKVFRTTCLKGPAIVFPDEPLTEAVAQACTTGLRSILGTMSLRPLRVAWSLPGAPPAKSHASIEKDVTIVSALTDGGVVRLVVLEASGALLDLRVPPLECVDMFLEWQGIDMDALMVFLFARAHYIRREDVRKAGPDVVAFDYPGTTKNIYCVRVPIVHYANAAKNLEAMAWTEPVHQAYLLTKSLAIGSRATVTYDASGVNPRGRVAAEITSITPRGGAPFENHELAYIAPVFSHRPELRMIGFLVLQSPSYETVWYGTETPPDTSSLLQVVRTVTIDADATLEDVFLATLASLTVFHVFMRHRDAVLSLLSTTTKTVGLNGVCCFDVPSDAPLFVERNKGSSGLLVDMCTEAHRHVVDGTFVTEIENTYAQCHQVGLVSPGVIARGVSNFEMLRAVMQHTIRRDRNERLLIRTRPPSQDRPEGLDVHAGGYIGTRLTGVVYDTTNQFDYGDNYASIIVHCNICVTSFEGFGTNGQGVFRIPGTRGLAPLAFVFKTLMATRKEARQFPSRKAIADAAKGLTVRCYGCVKLLYRWIGDAITTRGYEQLRALVSHIPQPVFWHTDGVQAVMSDEAAAEFLVTHGKPSADAGAVLELKPNERFTRFFCIESGISAGVHKVDGKVAIEYRGTHNKHKSEPRIVRDIVEAIIRILLAYNELQAGYIVAKVVALLDPLLGLRSGFDDLAITHEPSGIAITGKEPHNLVQRRLFLDAMAGRPVSFPRKHIVYAVCTGRRYVLREEFDARETDRAWYVKRIFGLVRRYLKFLPADTLYDVIIDPLSVAVSEKSRFALSDIGSTPASEWTHVCVLCEDVKRATDGPCACIGKLWPKVAVQ